MERQLVERSAAISRREQEATRRLRNLERREAAVSQLELNLKRERETPGALECQLDEWLQAIIVHEESQRKLIQDFNERFRKRDEEAMVALDQRLTKERAQHHEEWRRKATQQHDPFEEKRHELEW
jgi:hypothetical protein